MKYIELSKSGKNKGKFSAIVDDEDYEELNKYKWNVNVKSNTIYVVRTIYNKGEKSIIRMHRHIMNCPNNLYVDHINNNGLDNRKENLRICTHVENNRNRLARSNTQSKYKGVSIQKIKYKNLLYEYVIARIHVNKKSIKLGVFKTEIEAAKAYDNAAKIYFGEFSKSNFS